MLGMHVNCHKIIIRTGIDGNFSIARLVDMNGFASALSIYNCMKNKLLK